MRKFISRSTFQLCLLLLSLTLQTRGIQAQTKCRTALSNDRFEAYKSSISGEGFSSNQMEVAKFTPHCLSTAQIKEVMGLFGFESMKLDYAKWAYSNCVDKENYLQLNPVFGFSSSRTELMNYIRSQPKEPEPETTEKQQIPDKTTVVIPDQQPRKTEPAPVKPDPKTQVIVPNPTPVYPNWEKEQRKNNDRYNDTYQKARERMQNFFIMTLGGEDGMIENQSDAHKPTEDESELAPKAPRVVIMTPELNESNQFTAHTKEKKTTISGVISSTIGIYEVFINEQEAILNAKGEFFGDVLLALGENQISIRAKDTKGQVARIGFKIIRENGTPKPEPQPEPVVKEEVPPAPVPEAEFVSSVDQDIPKLKNSNKDAIAVVIGNQKYTKTKPVDFAVNDARSFKKYLIQVLGFKEGNILYFENATLGDMNTVFGTKGNPKGRLFNTIKQKVSDVVIFYSGHGAPGLKSSKAYFVPVEADPNYMENSGYELDVLYDNLKKLPAKSITLFSDACFSGADVFENISPMVIRSKEPVKEGMKNTSLLNSCTGTEVSCWHKEERHGLFTFYLLQAMKNYKETDLNKDKQISLDELFKSVSDNNEGVPYYARRAYGLNQTPVLQGPRSRILFKYQ